jgi:hypothetical protein
MKLGKIFNLYRLSCTAKGLGSRDAIDTHRSGGNKATENRNGYRARCALRDSQCP